MNAPHRIALVLDGAGLGGTERHVRDLANGLLRLEGARISLHLVTSADGPLVQGLRSHGVETCVVPRPDTFHYLSALSRHFRRVQPALVHAHSGRVACLAARLAGVAHVVETRHGIGERESASYVRWPLLRRLESGKSALADCSIAVCDADAAWLRGAGFSARRLVTIPNGIEWRTDVDFGALRRRNRHHWKASERALVLGFAGRLSRQKEPERLLELLRALLERGSDALLCVFGAGPLEAALKQESRRLGLEGRVRWQGIVNDRDAIFPGLDLLLLPSTWEGLPYVVLDALECEVPVLSTPVGGVPELLAHASAELPALPWNPVTWAECVLSGAPVRARDELRSDRARARLGRYSVDNMVASTRDLYHRLLRA